jgi:Mg-chelatase subunit ChlD
MAQCAKALAAIEGRTEVEAYDIWKASTLVVDTEPGGRGAERSICRDMACLSDGSYLKLSELSVETIEEEVAFRLGVVASPGSRSTSVKR